MNSTSYWACKLRNNLLAVNMRGKSILQVSNRPHVFFKNGFTFEKFHLKGHSTFFKVTNSELNFLSESFDLNFFYGKVLVFNLKSEHWIKKEAHFNTTYVIWDKSIQLFLTGFAFKEAKISNVNYSNNTCFVHFWF